MRFFRLEVEIAFKAIGVMALIGLVVLPVGWGYRQRQQARTWHRVACTYRIREVARETSSLVTVDARRDPCVHTRTAWFRSRDVTVTARQSAPER